MKILSLIASRRSPGNSEILVKQASNAAQKAGAEVETINITDLNIASCEGCLACVFRGKCREEDQMDTLVEKLIQADGLIVAAPIYLLSPASVIKKIMDRALMMSLYIDDMQGRRRGSLNMTVAGKADWNPIGMEMMNQFALSFGFPVYNYREAYAPGPGEILLQDDLMEDVASLGAGLVSYLRGETEPRPPEPNQCPSCYSRSVRLLGENKIQCPFCLVEGTLENNHINIPQEVLNDAFWTPQHRKRHLEDWIKATRGRYMKNREAVKQKLKDFS
ncbi:flavodoxin family protein [Dethiobacter alkaliphilus]|uniref:flavodoxin family protein n=1 Tax=Dethiobacter alkaliphilus TaxID=427926 RepID=UPI00222791C1|nr:flavodoxin family protein [Dethiobacter alkaliphilus]MCW3491551.1 flavodoxin family protein [Dethiobacter alkaliphilus]